MSNHLSNSHSDNDSNCRAFLPAPPEAHQRAMKKSEKKGRNVKKEWVDRKIHLLNQNERYCLIQEVRGRSIIWSASEPCTARELLSLAWSVDFRGRKGEFYALNIATHEKVSLTY